MKNVLLLLILASFVCCGTGNIVFMNENMVSAFGGAFSDFERENVNGYSVFIEEKEKLVVVSFIQYGNNNEEGRPVAYGKNITYEMNGNKILSKKTSYDK